MRYLEVRVPPLALTLAFAIVMALVADLVPAAQVHIPARSLLAVVLVVAGMFVALAGVLAFRQNKTTVNPFTPDQSSSLVASGIYRLSRNPMYLGYLMALVGCSLHLANWAAALLLPLFVAYLNKFQIQPEERALSAKFGPQFARYTKAVRRWV